MKKGFLKGYIAGAVTIAVLGGVIFTGTRIYSLVVGSQSDKISEKVSDKLDYLQLFINQYYLEDAGEADMDSGIYKGLVNSLGDPYSAYYTKEEYEELIESQSGEYKGIGVLVSQEKDTGIINILSVYDNTPAQEAGMKDGDILYKVEGEEITGTDLDKVVARIKGEEGSTVKLTVYRESSGEYIDMEVARRKIDVPTVSYEMVDKEEKIGYIAISQFDEKTDEHFMEAMEDLQSQGMKSVVFDVRNNPGGLYETVCNMLDTLLPEGTIVYTMDKYGKKQETTSDAECVEIPMVVLINGDSASASEIFAGAIQDYDVGTIIGTQSFGKGIVQSLMPLSDGSAIKLTVSKYYTPNGVNIHGTGIAPDVEVEQPADSEEDVQLKKAIEELSK